MDGHTPIWADIPEWPGYQAADRPVRDDLAQIRSLDRVINGRMYAGSLLKPLLKNRGYLQVNIRRKDPETGKSEPKTIAVHVLVLQAHRGPCPDGMQARHLDDNPLNNAWAPGDEVQSQAAGGNLIWGTAPENAADKKWNRPSVPSPSVTSAPQRPGNYGESRLGWWSRLARRYSAWRKAREAAAPKPPTSQG